MAMELERIGDGEYLITLNERQVKVERGLNRKWAVYPVNFEAEEKPAKSYADGKKIGQRMLMEAKATPKAPGSGKSARRGPDVLASIEDIESRLADLKRTLAK